MTTWRMLLAHTCLLHAIASLQRPTATYRALELGASVTEIGIVGGAFALLPLMLGRRVGVAMGHRGGRWALIMGSALVLASCTLAALANSVALLILSMLLLGLGHLACALGQQYEVSLSASAERLDERLGHYTVAGSIAQAVGPALLMLGSSGSAVPSQRLLGIGAVLAVAMMLVGCATSGSVLRAGSAAAEQVDAAPRRGELRSALMTGALVLASVDILAVYLPLVISEREGPAYVAGLLLTLRAVASTLSRAGFGRLIRRLGRERLLVASLLGSGTGIGLLAFDLPVAVLVVTVLVAGFCLGVGQPITISWVVAMTSIHRRGEVLATRLVANRAAQLVLPVAGGGVAVLGGAGAVLLLTAVCLVGVGVDVRRVTSR